MSGRINLGFYELPAQWWEMSREEQVDWAEDVIKAMLERERELGLLSPGATSDGGGDEEWPGGRLPSDHS